MCSALNYDEHERAGVSVKVQMNKNANTSSKYGPCFLFHQVAQGHQHVQCIHLVPVRNQYEIIHPELTFAAVW